MRISTKLSGVVACVFLTIGGIGILASRHLGEVADATAAVQAKNVALEIAGMVTYQTIVSTESQQAGRSSYQDLATLQKIVNFVGANSKYSVEIFDARKLTIADVVQGDVGKQIEQERERPVSMTLKDGIARAYQLTDAEYPDGTRQVVVPIKGGNQNIIAALVLDYTPLYNDMALRKNMFGT